jgi:3-ketosteroid 9alpha-monooxygenase subunit A
MTDTMPDTAKITDRVTATTAAPGTDRGRMTTHAGWYLLAFDDEIGDRLTPCAVGRKALVAVRDGDRVRVFDATCPHRGAHLGYGGKLDADAIVCPFHGKRISLGDGSRRWSVREHRVLRAGSAIFVRFSGSPDEDRGFERAMTAIAAARQVVGALTVPIAVPVDLVVENAFDIDHFSAVHMVPRVIDMELRPDAAGALVIEGAFETGALPWEKAVGRTSRSRFLARAFSPSVVVSELGPPEMSHVVVTGAIPTAGGCVARVAIGVCPREPGGPAPAGILDPLIAGARHAFDQDIAVWEHLDLDAPQRLDVRDEPVRAFRRFCAGFPSAR